MFYLNYLNLTFFPHSVSCNNLTYPLNNTMSAINAHSQFSYTRPLKSFSFTLSTVPTLGTGHSSLPHSYLLLIYISHCPFSQPHTTSISKSSFSSSSFLLNSHFPFSLCLNFQALTTLLQKKVCLIQYPD
jgi:hypothetical protein